MSARKTALRFFLYYSCWIASRITLAFPKKERTQMASIDDLNAAVAALTSSVNDLIAAAQTEDAAEAAPVDFQPQVDQLTAANEQAQTFLHPAA